MTYNQEVPETPFKGHPINDDIMIPPSLIGNIWMRNAQALVIVIADKRCGKNSI